MTQEQKKFIEKWTFKSARCNKEMGYYKLLEKQLAEDLTNLLDNWISVEDELPEIDKYVLWYCESGIVFFECIDKDWDEKYLKDWIDNFNNNPRGIITHWTTIQPPKE